MRMRRRVFCRPSSKPSLQQQAVNPAASSRPSNKLPIMYRKKYIKSPDMYLFEVEKWGTE
jgi:hypothetical protein